MKKKTRYLTEPELSVQEIERIVSAKGMHNMCLQMPCGEGNMTLTIVQNQDGPIAP